MTETKYATHYDHERTLGIEMEDVGNEPVLFKKVLGSRHLYRKLDAWCWDKALIDEAKVSVVVVYDIETDLTYWTTLGTVIESGVVIHHPPHGPQYALPRASWAIETRRMG